MGLNSTMLNGVNDNRSIARVAGLADDRYKVGSALMQRLMMSAASTCMLRFTQSRTHNLC